jgi:hypothetical protein
LQLHSFLDLWNSTLSLTSDNRYYAQSMICIYCWQFCKLRNSIIFQRILFQLIKSFYFNVLSQFSLYTDLSNDLDSLYRSEEVLLDLEDIQGVVQPYST